MSYNGSGVFNINTSGQPVVTGTVISSTAFNALTADLATGLTTAITKDGQTTPTANIPMGGFKITGIAAATTLGDALSYGRAATVSTLTNSALTSGRVPYASTAGLLTDSASLTYDGTTLTATTGANFATSSGNVGIGTSSPSTKLEVTGNAKLTGTNLSIIPSTATNSAYLLNTNTGGNFFFGIDSSTGASFTGTAYGRFLYSSGAYPMIFLTNDTERMRIDSSGNLLVGTTTTPSSSGMSLGTTGTVRQLLGGMTNTSWRLREGVNVDYAVLSTNINDSGTQDNSGKSSWRMGMGYGNVIDNWAVYRAPAGSSTFTQAMTLDASGNLGIGTTSPGQKLHLSNSASSTYMQMTANTCNGYIGQQTDGEMRLVTSSSGSFMTFQTEGAERMRLDSSGRLLVNTTTASPSGYVTVTCNTTTAGWSSYATSTATTSQMIFKNSNGDVGTITTGASATAYNTSSDYRLKNTITPMTGALAKVALLKPCTYKWNVDGSDGEGFIAHELAEVVPQCVTGEKDAVDEDGKPKYQGIDTSFLVATLTAAIQELTARLTALESK